MRRSASEYNKENAGFQTFNDIKRNNRKADYDSWKRRMDGRGFYSVE